MRYTRSIRLLGGPQCGGEFRSDKDMAYWTFQTPISKVPHKYRRTPARASDGAHLFVSEDIRMLGFDPEKV